MEDTSSVKHIPGLSLYAVFDGHAGSSVAEFLRAECLQAVVAELSYHLLQDAELTEVGETSFDYKSRILDLCDNLLNEYLRDAFIEAFSYLDEQLAAKKDSAGSTAIAAALVQRKRGKRKLVVANTGDCRGVMATKSDNGILTVVALSNDHKPGRPDELRRIEKAGGYVSDTGLIPRVNGVLAVSRAFGDFTLKKKGVIVEPEITEFDITEKDEFFILASDGLWDVFSNLEAIQFVHKKLVAGVTIEQTSRDLVQKAFEKGSQDNITVLIILLNLTANPVLKKAT